MKINFTVINHVNLCIPVGAENEARDFYAGVLKLKEIEKPEALKKNGGLWFEIAGIQLHLSIEEPVVKTRRHPAFEVENLASVKQYLISNNIQIKEETKIPGQERFSFHDPFGNRIELLEKNNVDKE